MTHTCKLMLLTAACIAAFSGVSYAAATFSDNWVQETDGSWTARDKNTNILTNVWFCDDAVPANGKDVWYLLDQDGKMVTAGLVQDATGNYYSLETNHNGYYGMLRYKSGTYDGIYLDLESSHEGSFAAIKNQDGIEKLKTKYGLTQITIGNGNIVYSSNEVHKKATTEGWATYANGTKYYYENEERVKGWKQIGESWYYFNKSTGAMLTDAYTPDGYYVDENGVWDGKAATSSKITEKTTAKTTTSTTTTTKTGSTSGTTTKTGTSTGSSTKTGSASVGTFSTTGPGASAGTDSGSGDDAEDSDDASGEASSSGSAGTSTAATDASGQTLIKKKTVADPEWDSASVTKLKTCMTNAKASLTEARTLYNEGKALTTARDKMKKYNKATGKACGALTYFETLDALLKDRPDLKLSDGTEVSSLSAQSQKLLDSLCDLTLDEDTDLDSAEVTAEMEKIVTVLENVEKILALAGTM